MLPPDPERKPDDAFVQPTRLLERDQVRQTRQVVGELGMQLGPSLDRARGRATRPVTSSKRHRYPTEDQGEEQDRAEHRRERREDPAGDRAGDDRGRQRHEPADEERVEGVHSPSPIEIGGNRKWKLAVSANCSRDRNSGLTDA